MCVLGGVCVVVVVGGGLNSIFYEKYSWGICYDLGFLKIFYGRILYLLIYDNMILLLVEKMF